MLLVTLLPADQRTWILTSICLAMASCDLSVTTFAVNHLDIGGHYAGFLMGLSNCFASVPGILIPTLTGHIVLDGHVRNSLLFSTQNIPYISNSIFFIVEIPMECYI